MFSFKQLYNFVSDTFFISHLVRLHKSPRKRRNTKLHSCQQSTCNHKGIIENYLQKDNLLTFIRNGNPLSSQWSSIQTSIKSIRISLTKLSLRRIWHDPTTRKNSTTFSVGKKGNMNKFWLGGMIDYCDYCKAHILDVGNSKTSAGIETWHWDHCDQWEQLSSPS